MRLIRTVSADVIKAFDAPTESITPALVDSLFEPVRQNKLRVLDTMWVIENAMIDIISHHFFGWDECNKDRKCRFTALVLSSNWCAFRNKQDLVGDIVNETSALQGQEKNELQDLLRKCASVRNALIHGVLATDGRRVELLYYEARPRTDFLDDEYFAKVESNLNRCWDLLKKVSVATGATRKAVNAIRNIAS